MGGVEAGGAGESEPGADAWRRVSLSQKGGKNKQTTTKKHHCPKEMVKPDDNAEKAVLVMGPGTI